MAKKKSPTTPTAIEGLKPVETLAEEMNLASWEMAGLMQAAGWSQGKAVTETTFVKTLDNFRNRPQGGGRIEV
jgi:hypothetical protein